MVNRKYNCEGGNIDEKYDTLGILSCWHRYSFLISLLFHSSLLAIPSSYRLGTLPFRAEGLSFLSLPDAGSHVCRWIPDFKFPFSHKGVHRFKRGKKVLLSILRK